MTPGRMCMPVASKNSRANGMASRSPTANTRPSLMAMLASMTVSGVTRLPLQMTRSAVTALIAIASQHGPAPVDRKVGAGDLARRGTRQEQAGIGNVAVDRHALERVFGGVPFG